MSDGLAGAMAQAVERARSQALSEQESMPLGLQPMNNSIGKSILDKIRSPQSGHFFNRGRARPLDTGTASQILSVISSYRPPQESPIDRLKRGINS